MGQIGVAIVGQCDESSAVAALQAASDITVVRTVQAAEEGASFDGRADDNDVVVGVASNQRDGVALVETVQSTTPDVPVVVVDCSPPGATAALAAGAEAVVPAGATEELLIETVRTAADRSGTAAAAERYRTLVETVGDAMYVLDETGHLEYVNDAHVELSGYSREELLGSYVGEFMPEDAVERGAELIAELLSSPDKEWARFEFTATRSDGEQRYYEDNLAVLTDDGEFVGSVGIIRDITARKRAEQELERQNERLEQFASVVSHDLRNPITVARGHLNDGLADGDLEAAAREALVSLDRMETIIEDVLVLARESADIGDREVVELESVAEDAWAVVDSEDATLEMLASGTVEADRSRLQQALENLFRNAVEHSERAVTVRVGRTDEGFVVEDDGPGIPDGIGEEVFEWGMTTSGEGTGLGLAIVAQIVRAHGWSIVVEESEWGGCRFVVSGIDTGG